MSGYTVLVDWTPIHTFDTYEEAKLYHDQWVGFYGARLSLAQCAGREDPYGPDDLDGWYDDDYTYDEGWYDDAADRSAHRDGPPF